MLDHLWEEREGYVLLGRVEGNIPGYLSYSAEEGEVVCAFESVIEAERFYVHCRARIPGEGWDTVRPGTGELIKVLRNFDPVNPQSDRALLDAGDGDQDAGGRGEGLTQLVDPAIRAALPAQVHTVQHLVDWLDPAPIGNPLCARLL